MKYILIMLTILSVSCSTNVSKEPTFILKAIIECNSNNTIYKNEIYFNHFIISRKMENSFLEIKRNNCSEKLQTDSSKFFGSFILQWNDNSIDTFLIYKKGKSISSSADLSVIYKNCEIQDNSFIIRAFLFSLPLFISEKYIDVCFPTNEYDYLFEKYFFS